MSLELLNNCQALLKFVKANPLAKNDAIVPGASTLIVGNIQISPVIKGGICQTVDKLEYYSTLLEYIFSLWPGHSGRKVFPIPGGFKQYNKNTLYPFHPRVAYCRQRVDLLEFTVSYLEAMYNV